MVGAGMGAPTGPSAIWKKGILRRVTAQEVDLLVKGHRAHEFIDTFVHRRGIVGNELCKSGDTRQQERTNEKATAYITVRIRGHREILLREMVRRKKGREHRDAIDRDCARRKRSKLPTISPYPSLQCYPNDERDQGQNHLLTRRSFNRTRVRISWMGLGRFRVVEEILTPVKAADNLYEFKA